MATYNFSPNGALDTGAELAHVTAQLEASLADLWVKVNQFLNANQSISRDIYNAAQVEWSAGQEQMRTAMGKGVVALDQINAEYVLADNRGAQVFGQNL